MADKYFRAGFTTEHKPGSVLDEPEKPRAKPKPKPAPTPDSGQSKKKFLPSAPTNPAVERIAKAKELPAILPKAPAAPRAYPRKKVDPNVIPELPFVPKPKKKAEEPAKKKIRRDSPAEIELELRKYHWGAFLLVWLWGFGNRVWTGALFFVPLLGLCVPFVLGSHGRRWAWENNDWQDLAHFRRVQRVWTIAGVTSFVVGSAAFGIFVAPTAVRMGVKFYEDKRAALATPDLDAVLGTRRSIGKAVPFDGARAVMALADGVIGCATKTGQLPDSSHRVPEKWLGATYISLRSDWKVPAFECANFRVEEPQAYRYQWKRTGPLGGMAVAETDFDERGEANTELVIQVACTSPGICRAVSGKRHTK